MKMVQVLMSTYNGEKYLREQIDSILKQDCERQGVAALRLLVRDDGSTDGTQGILAEYAEAFPQCFRWYQGENVGVIRSFFALLEESDDSADYYAFADQDDYWLPEKLRVGIEALNGLKEQEKPNLYCCRPKLVDENLRELESNIKRPPMRPAFENALVENIVTGCTIIMNPVLRNMVRQEPPKYTVMHDWWFYLVAAGFGNLIYDETSYICYRQHGGNQVGTNVSRLAEFRERVRRFKGNRRNISNQMSEFLRIFGGQGGEHVALAQELLDSRTSFRKRWRLVRSGRVYRQRKNDDRIFRLILLSGSF